MNRYTLAALLGSATAISNADKYAQSSAGFLEAYGGHFNPEALLWCIEYVDETLLFFDIASIFGHEAVKNKDWIKLIPTASAIFFGFQALKSSLAPCESIDTTSFDYLQLQKNLDVLEHPL